MTQEELFKKLVAHCKEYGFIFPSSEIYDGLSAVYDYGQMGVELKNNIKRYWWDSMTKLHDNIVGIDAAIFMHPRVWGSVGTRGRLQRPADRQQGLKKALPCRRAHRRLDYQTGRKDRQGGRKRAANASGNGSTRSSSAPPIRAWRRLPRNETKSTPAWHRRSTPTTSTACAKSSSTPR